MRNATVIEIEHEGRPQWRHVVVHFFSNAKLVETLALNEVSLPTMDALDNFLSVWASGNVATIHHKVKAY